MAPDHRRRFRQPVRREAGLQEEILDRELEIGDRTLDMGKGGLKMGEDQRLRPARWFGQRLGGAGVGLPGPCGRCFAPF